MTKPIFQSLEEIATIYQAATSGNDGYVMRDWRALSKAVHRSYAKVEADWGIIVTDDPEPYPNVEAMYADLTEDKPFRVSRANSAHPLWTVETNVAFRTAHDVFGHWRARELWGGVADFTWMGELEACAAHALKLDTCARRALFVECIAQTGAAIFYGRFLDQKVIGQFGNMLPQEVRNAYLNYIDNPMTLLVT